MQIFIRELSERTTTLDLHNGDDTTVQQLKSLIQDKVGTRAEEQILYCAGGKLMENDVALKEYDVKDGAVLYLIHCCPDKI